MRVKFNVVSSVVGFLFLLGSLIPLANAADTVTLSFQGHIGLFKHTQPSWEKIKTTFEKEHPNVRIKYIGVPYEQQRTQTVITAAGGNPADVIQFTAQWVSQIAAMGATEPLEKYFTEKELGDIPRGLLESSKYQGVLHSFPWTPGAICLARNKNLLEQAGFDPNKAPEDWDVLTDMIERIGALDTTEKGGKIYGIVLRTSKDTNAAFWTFPVMWAFGGKFVDPQGKIIFDSPGTVEAYKWYQKMGLNEYTPVGLHITEVRSLFALGRGGFILEGPWTKGVVTTASGGKMKLTRDYDVSLMPKGEDGISHAIANNHVLLLSKQSKHKELGAELIKHITANREIVLYHYEVSGVIATPFKRILTSPPFSDSPYVQTFVSQLATSDAAPFKHPMWDASLEFVAVAMQKAIMGKDVEAAVKEAANAIRTLLGQ